MTQAEELLSTDTAIVLRVRGKPRGPLDGKHRRIVVFAETTLSTLDLAEILEETADRLVHPGPRPPVSPTVFL